MGRKLNTNFWNVQEVQRRAAVKAAANDFLEKYQAPADKALMNITAMQDKKKS